MSEGLRKLNEIGPRSMIFSSSRSAISPTPKGVVSGAANRPHWLSFKKRVKSNFNISILQNIT